MTKNNKDDELRSVIHHLQTYEENIPESIKLPRQKGESSDIERQQLREIRSITRNVRIITIIVVVIVLLNLIVAILSKF